MGAKFVEAIVSGFTEAGTGLATGLVGSFDAVTSTAEGALTGVAEVGLTMIGFSIMTGFVFGLVKRFSRKVR